MPNNLWKSAKLFSCPSTSVYKWLSSMCKNLAIISSSFRLQFLAWDRPPRNLANSFLLCIRVLRFWGNCAILQQSKHSHSIPSFSVYVSVSLAVSFAFLHFLVPPSQIKGASCTEWAQRSFSLWDMPIYKSYITNEITWSRFYTFLSFEIFQLVMNWMIFHLLDIWSILSLVLV